MGCSCLKFSGSGNRPLCSIAQDQLFDFVNRKYTTQSFLFPPVFNPPGLPNLAENWAIGNNPNTGTGGAFLGTPLTFGAAGVESIITGSGPFAGSFPFLLGPASAAVFGNAPAGSYFYGGSLGSGHGWQQFAGMGGVFVIEFTPTGAQDWLLIQAPETAGGSNLTLTYKAATGKVECDLIGAGFTYAKLSQNAAAAGTPTRVVLTFSVGGICQMAMSVNGQAPVLAETPPLGLTADFTPYLYGNIEADPIPTTLGSTALVALFIPSSALSIPLNPALLARSQALSVAGAAIPSHVSYLRAPAELIYPTLLNYGSLHAPTGDQQSVVDWATGKNFQYGSNGFMTRYDTLSGTEEAFALQASYTGFSLFSQCWTNLDGNIYNCGPGTVGGESAICQISGATLAELSFENTPFGVQNGSGSGVNGGAPFFASIALGPGDIAGSQVDCFASPVHVYFHFNWPTPTGGNSTAVSCAGAINTGVGYVMVGPGGVPGAGDGVWLYDCNTVAVTQVLIRKFLPTDIDATWTAFSAGGAAGMLFDKTDGNLILAIAGNGAISGYLVKVNPGTGAIVWKLPSMGATGGAPGGGNVMQFSDISHGKYKYFQAETAFGAIPAQIVQVDTIAGTQTSSYIGLSGVGGGQGQSYSDTLDAIFLNVSYSGGTGGLASDAPLLKGTTPGAFTGPALLQLGTVARASAC